MANRNWRVRIQARESLVMWTHRIHRLRGLLLGASVAAALLLAIAGNARAGTYTVYSCRTPSDTAAQGWWTQSRIESLTAFGDSCPGGALTIDMSRAAAHPANDYARLNFWAAPDTTIGSYFIWRTVQLHAGYDYVRYEHVNGKWVGVQYCSGCTIGRPADPLDQRNLVSDSNLSGVTGLSMLVSCGQPDTSPTPCPAVSPAADLQIYRADITLNDPFPPVLAGPPSGSLLSGRPLSGVQSAKVSATDRGGGVYQATVVVDGGEVARTVLDPNGGLCHAPFVSRTPCKTHATGAVAVDTTRLSDGLHSLRLTVTDATGTNSTSYGPVWIRTANGACNPTPLSASTRLSGGLVAHTGAKPATRITASYGQPPIIAGTLTGVGGAPIAGATVCVETQNDNVGAGLQPAGLVTTNASGGFSFQLPAGPSRRVVLVRHGPDGAALATLRLQVHASVSLRGSPRALHNRQVLKLRGALVYGPVPSTGVLVELQAPRGRHRWQTFATTMTRPDGQFSYNYRFTRTTGVRRYSLRARVAAQDNYPYLTGTSRAVKVRVSGHRKRHSSRRRRSR